MRENETPIEVEKVRREKQQCVQKQTPNIQTARLPVTLASPDRKKAPLFYSLLSSETAGDESYKAMKVVENIGNKILMQTKNRTITIPGTVKEQNVGVNINGNQIKLLNAGKSLNPKDFPNVTMVIKDLKNVFPNLKPNSTVVLVKKRLNPTSPNSSSSHYGNAHLSTQLDHTYALTPKAPSIVNDPYISGSSKVVAFAEDSPVSTVECLTNDSMDLGYNYMLNGLAIEESEKTKEIEEQVVYETLSLEQSPTPVFSKRGRPIGEKQHESRVVGGNSVAPKKGSDLPKGRKKQKIEHKIVRGNIHSLMKELPPVRTYRKTFSDEILRETSVMINRKKTNEKRSLSRSSNFHSHNAAVFDHAYSSVSTECKNSSAQIRDVVSAESSVDPLKLTYELDGAQIISDLPIKRKPVSNEVQTLVHSHKEKKRQSSYSLVQFEASTFFSDDEKVEFYTGIDSIEKLWLLFRYVEDRIEIATSSSDSANRLPLFEQFCLTLIRLRLNLKPKDMSNRFGLKLPELIDYITRLFSIMFKFLVPAYIHWSNREDINSTLPNCFKLSGLDDCVCIVELLEVFLSRDFFSKDDKCKKLTYLIGFTPTGLVSFVSIGFPASSKKENIWLKSGILNQLEHGDWVLAETGKLVYKAEALKKTVNPFVENFGLQLVLVDEEETFSKRIVIQRHCKRVVESLKKRFAIFQTEITGLSSVSPLAVSWNGMATVDQMVKVCCALHNNS